MLKIYSTEEYNEQTFPEEEFLESGIAGVDNAIGGYCRSELTVISAPSSNGKSIVTLSSALYMSMKYKVLYLSLENSIATDHKRRKQIIEKYEIKEPNFYYYNADLDLDKSGFVTLEEIEEVLKDENYDIVFVDSIDFVGDAMNSIDGMSSFGILNRLSAGLRKLAAKYNCAVVITSQLNRNGMQKKNIEEMSMADMQGSVGICQKAHSVWAINKNDSWAMKIVKNRSELKDGHPGVFRMHSAVASGFNIRYDSSKINKK